MITSTKGACVIDIKNTISIVISEQSFLWYKRITIYLEFNGYTAFRKVKFPKGCTSVTNAYLDKKLDDVIQLMIIETLENSED